MATIREIVEQTKEGRDRRTIAEDLDISKYSVYKYQTYFYLIKDRAWSDEYNE